MLLHMFYKKMRIFNKSDFIGKKTFQLAQEIEVAGQNVVDATIEGGSMKEESVSRVLESILPQLQNLDFIWITNEQPTDIQHTAEREIFLALAGEGIILSDSLVALANASSAPQFTKQISAMIISNAENSQLPFQKIGNILNEMGNLEKNLKKLSKQIQNKSFQFVFEDDESPQKQSSYQKREDLLSEYYTLLQEHKILLTQYREINKTLPYNLGSDLEEQISAFLDPAEID